MTGLLPVGFELGCELTYPEPENTSSGLLNAASQIFGIAFTYIYDHLLDGIGTFWANGALCGTLLVGTIICCFISSKQKRQTILSMARVLEIEGPSYKQKGKGAQNLQE